MPFPEHHCERPDLRLVAETERFRRFFCMTCHLDWIISRSRARAAAQEENRLAAIRTMTEAERRANRKTFGKYYAGRRQ